VDLLAAFDLLYNISTCRDVVDLLWTCCRLVVDLLYSLLYNKSNKWSLTLNANSGGVHRTAKTGVSRQRADEWMSCGSGAAGGGLKICRHCFDVLTAETIQCESFSQFNW